jgi:hypothetical protein
LPPRVATTPEVVAVEVDGGRRRRRNGTSTEPSGGPSWATGRRTTGGFSGPTSRTSRPSPTFYT